MTKEIRDQQPSLYLVKAPTITALELRIKLTGVSKFHRRTYVLGMVVGWPIAAIACLFGYDAKVWLWDADKGFRFAEFTKQGRSA